MTNERCKHNMLIGQCAMCSGQVTRHNQCTGEQSNFLSRGTSLDDAMQKLYGEKPKLMPEKECLISTCTALAKVRGVCKNHYNEWYAGKPDIIAELGPFKVRTPKNSPAKPDQPKSVEAPLAAPDSTPDNPGKIPSVVSNELTLETADYPDILPCLEEAAKTFIRTVPHQALYYIIKGLKDDGYGRQKEG